MIKLTNILNELEINNPRQITVEKAKQYFIDNIYNNGIEFGGSSNGWKEYLQICKPYREKYNLDNWIHLLHEFKKLSQPDLIKLFNEMRRIVKKYVGKEILNELEINNPRQITVEKVEQYYKNNIYNNDVKFWNNTNCWKEYIQMCKPYYEKYGMIGDFTKFSSSDLTKFYNEMRKLVKKHVGKEILNELSINNPLVTVEEALDAWEKYCNVTYTPHTKLFATNSHELLFKYGYTYNTNHDGGSHVEKWLKKLKQSDLNKFYKDCINMLNNE